MDLKKMIRKAEGRPGQPPRCLLHPRAEMIWADVYATPKRGRFRWLSTWRMYWRCTECMKPKPAPKPVPKMFRTRPARAAACPCGRKLCNRRHLA